MGGGANSLFVLNEGLGWGGGWLVQGGGWEYLPFLGAYGSVLVGTCPGAVGCDGVPSGWPSVVDPERGTELHSRFRPKKDIHCLGSLPGCKPTCWPASQCLAHDDVVKAPGSGWFGPHHRLRGIRVAAWNSAKRRFALI